MKNTMSFLTHIRACTHYDPAKFAPFIISDKRLGYVLPDIRSTLHQSGLSFHDGINGLALAPDIDTYETRTRVLAQAAVLLAQHHNAQLRDEMFPVLANWHEKPLAEIDRAALPWFGIRGFGVHVNGFVRKQNDLYVWIAERAHDRLVDPGKLDNLIGGGMALGYSPEETLIKEAFEEAGIPKELAQKAKPTGTLNYKVELMGGLRNDTLFIYDLVLPEDFVPRNTDGEVHVFNLIPAQEVAALVETTDRFKFNCNLVIIDFLLRHGLIGTDHPDYSALVTALMAIRNPPFA